MNTRVQAPTPLLQAEGLFSLSKEMTAGSDELVQVPSPNLSPDKKEKVIANLGVVLGLEFWTYRYEFPI